ncbi:hypothetical protein MMC07_006110 [Pseudocyphellaria aurata]|nr:hypothetical protein [Pseudocyphellaria aurata]
MFKILGKEVLKFFGDNGNKGGASGGLVHPGVNPSRVGLSEEISSDFDLDVMLRAIFSTGQTLRSNFSPLSASISGIVVLKAFVSTNTAILRGIRQSKPKRSESGKNYGEKKKGNPSPKQKMFEARNDFGSNYSGDRKERRSPEQKYTQVRSEFGSRYSGDRKERRSPEQKYPEVRSEFGSKYSGDRKERRSPEQKYPEARSGFRSNYSGDRKGRLSTAPRAFSVERNNPGANRSTYGSMHREDSGEGREKFRAKKSNFGAEKREPGAKGIATGFKYKDERKRRFSGESRTFPAKQMHSRDNREDHESRFDRDRRERFSAELRAFRAEQKYSHEKPPKPRYNEEQDVRDLRGSAALEKYRRTPKQEGYLRGGSRENESSRKPPSSDEVQNLRAISGSFRGNPMESAPKFTMNKNRSQGSAVDYESAQGSTRKSAYAISMDQPGDSSRPFLMRHDSDQNLDRGSLTRPYDERINQSNAYKKTPPRPAETNGMKVKSNPPRGIPYTTAASEFLYGTSVVLAALKFSRRKLYKMYIYTGENRSPSSQDETVRKLALAQSIEVVNVTGSWLQVLDKMSDGRPHNGYILEASSLPKLPVTGLQRVDRQRRVLKVNLDHQSREEEAINGTNQNIEFEPAFSRYPFVLFLDGVVDPGNLGAIIRSAFLFGVDAVAVSKRASAPLSPVALKASAGAADSLPLLSADNPVDFISQSRLNGWRTYAAVLPQSSGSKNRGSFTNNSLDHPILAHPCVLMIGGEGEGLARPLQKKADFTVSVEGARTGQGGVDSLNVSVATAILCDAFLRNVEIKPGLRSQPEQIGTQEASSDDDSTRLDPTGNVAINDDDPEPDLVIPDSSSDEKLQQTRDVDIGGEEEEATLYGLEAIDETKAHHYLDEESVGAPKDRLF